MTTQTFIFLHFIPASVIMWDSQVKDGYKRSQAPAADSDETSRSTAAPAAWDGKKTSTVVEELLRNATDKAYGANGRTLDICETPAQLKMCNQEHF